MRVVAGTARGMRLEPPRDQAVRPTLERVREALFDILGERVIDAAFLDLFAGTGAIGIEALSRGARQAVFVDSSAAHIELVRRNLTHTKLVHRAICKIASLPAGLYTIKGPFDIVYADPPHDFQDYSGLIQAIVYANLLADGGWLILEAPARAAIETPVSGLDLRQIRRYGRTQLAFFA